jgi:hypothetical protein
MKKFIENNFVIIVLVISLLTLFKSCNDGRQISKIQKDIQTIKDSSFTKQELTVILKIEGLKSEKRMIQATDRKILDVQRQSQIDEELSTLSKQVPKW